MKTTYPPLYDLSCLTPSLPFFCSLGVDGILGTIEKNEALFNNLENIIDVFI